MLRPRKQTRYQFEIQSSELERRDVPASSTGNTFAILPGDITTAGKSAAIHVNVTKDLFTMPKGRAVLGVAVAPITSGTTATTGASVSPKIVNVTDTSSRNVAVSSSPGMGRRAITTAVETSTAKPQLFNVRLNRHAKSSSYNIDVTDQNGGTGGFLSGFYLAGDASGDLKVDRTDVSTIKSLVGATASSSNYSFNADSNRDGKIDNSDVRIARQNTGVAVKVQPVITARLDPASDSGLSDRITSTRDVTFSGVATPGSTVTYKEVANKLAPATATTDASGNYSIVIGLADGVNTFQVTSKDGFGQSISGTLSPVTYTVDAPKSTT